MPQHKVVSPDDASKKETSAVGSSPIFARQGLTGNDYDALPVTFSSPVVPETLQPDDFEYTLKDGSKVTALIATLAPSNERNENNAVATVGRYGDGLGGTNFPVKLPRNKVYSAML